MDKGTDKRGLGDQKKYVYSFLYESVFIGTH